MNLPKSFGKKPHRIPPSKLFSQRVAAKEQPKIEVVHEPISVKFKRDFNIHDIDRCVKIKLRNEILSIETRSETLNSLRASLPKAHTVVASNEINLKIKELEDEIFSIRSGIKAIQYLNESMPILKRYDSIPKTTKVIDISDLKVDDGLDEVDELRIETIMEYASVASKYIKLDIIREGTKEVSGRCKTCGYDLRNVEVTIEGRQICVCGAEHYKTKVDKAIEDGFKSGCTTKDYSDEHNFKKAFYRFIGAQKITFDVDAVVAALDNYFRGVGHPPADYYRKQPHNKRGKKDGTSLYLLLEGLRSIGCPKLYEDANYIGSIIWGWKTHDLLHMEEIVMNHYRETQVVYDTMPLEQRARKSSLSTQFRLFKTLENIGVPCVIEDFKIPSQRDSLCKQESIWKYMCDNAGNPNIYYISTL
jgi:hypothetical protein